MTAGQVERIATALAYPDKDRDVRALVNEDNLITHGWIGTRMELDPDQLRGQSSGPRQPKVSAKASGSTTTPVPKQSKVQAGASGSTNIPTPSTRKRAATSSKKSAAPKTVVPRSLPPSEEVEDEEEAAETPEEPLRGGNDRGRSQRRP